MKLEKNILTVSEAACVLSCSTHIIYRLIHTHALGAYKDAGGHPWRIPDVSIKNYVATRMGTTTPMR